MEGEDEQKQPCPSPAQFLRDISNFKTPNPKRPSQNPRFHSPHPFQFFTASKHIPSPSPASSAFPRRRRPSSIAPPSSARSKAVSRRLKAFELEQSQSSRKVQIKKEKSLKCLAKSLTAWLNFLFENPKSCGCGPSGSKELGRMGKGKRESWPGSGAGVGLEWRSPKRQRDSLWRGEDFELLALPNSMFPSLRSSLQDVCSFDDLKQRMRVYLSLANCKEILQMMTQVTKSIDEGRLKMKAHCPIVTDVGMKKKAVKVLLSYNPTWLRIGLYIIFGGDSLLPDRDASCEQDISFIKMIIEKQFFSHPGLAKTFAYNKLVDGLFRAGYFETLGSVVLKRFLLLVLILDRAKSQGSLPIEYGIDGVDGGSPLLFSVKSCVKASQQMIKDFLSTDVMHGEGNLIGHLESVKYKVSYQQPPLIEYDFKVTDLFQDLQDGVRLCRAIQLLQQEPSILMKIIVPADSQKKTMGNCGIALQYLKQAGVSLDDDDGMPISGEDLANGDKELTLSLLWNVFVHLQLPLLINKTTLLEEIHKIRQVDAELPDGHAFTHLEMLLSWIQAICRSYDIQVDSFASVVDGRAMWCLLDYYFRKELHCSCSYKDASKVNRRGSIVADGDDTDAVHNFILSQKLMTLLGNFPEVLQISKILEYDGACSDRSVIILLVFLSFQLVVKKNTDQLNFHKLLGCTCPSSDRKCSVVDRCSLTPTVSSSVVKTDQLGDKDAATLTKFKAIRAWWQDMAERNCKSNASSLQFSWEDENCPKIQEAVAVVMQPHHRRLSDLHSSLQIKNAVSLLQIVILSWLKVKKILAIEKHGGVEKLLCDRFSQTELSRRYIKFIIDRHNFVKLRRSTLHIQREVRGWISRRHQQRLNMFSCNETSHPVNAAITIQTCTRQLMAGLEHVSKVSSVSYTRGDEDLNDLHMVAAIRIQVAWKNYNALKSICNQNSAATKIQCVIRGWLQRKYFVNMKCAALKIQFEYKSFVCRRALKEYIAANRTAAIVIQSHVRGWFAQRKIRQLRHIVITLQSYRRGCLIRRVYLLQRSAALKIQTAQRCLKCWCSYHSSRHSAIQIQKFIRGQITRRRLLGASRNRMVNNGTWIPHTSTGFHSYELRIYINSVLKLQRWWKVMLLSSKSKAAVLIQSHIRGWMVKRGAKREKQCILIQSFWRGYLARKESTRQLSDLRLRMQISATNVDDARRLINRLIVALSELQGMRSISCILHTCATLDVATKYSQRCCEELVAAGAINNLLKVLKSVSQSIPDQEVLKYALSTLNNLARYPHLVKVLIDNHECIQIIFWKFLRNKQEAFYIASELLKRICARPEGVGAVKNLPALLKMLHKQIEDLTRKLNNEKRISRNVPTKVQNARRLKEASDLLNLITMVGNR